MNLLVKSVALAAALGAATLASAQSWPTYGGDTGNTRYSEGTQVTAANVNKLSVKWALQLGSNRSQESSPILVGDTLYVTSSFGPKNVFAVNAKTGDVRWKWSPEMPKAIDQYACCDVNNRGAAYNDGLLWTKVPAKKCGAPTPCQLATKRMLTPGRVTLEKQAAALLGTSVPTIPS